MSENVNKSEVKLDKEKIFQYIPLPNEPRRLFCLQQSFAVLTWILYFKTNSLIPIRRSDSDPFSFGLIILWLRRNLGRLKARVKGLIVFSCYKYQLRRAIPIVDLPLYGQFCVPIHKGYKIFDLRREVVTKIFDDDVSPQIIKSEIEGLQQISQLNFAPSLRRWNIEKRWYEEDYLSGSVDAYPAHRPLDSKVVLKIFFSDVLQQINELMLLRQPITKNTEEYINGLFKDFSPSQLLKRNFNIREYEKITGFIDSICEPLRAEKEFPVCLVFTHGDFCPENMMHTRHGLKTIDWESATFRSALFDFYSYFFYRTATRNVPVETLYLEISEALPFLLSKLTATAHDMANSLSQSHDLYRKIYYVERISMLLEREKSDKNLNMVDHIVWFIDAFNRYEEMLAGIPEVSN